MYICRGIGFGFFLFKKSGLKGNQVKYLNSSRCCELFQVLNTPKPLL